MANKTTDLIYTNQIPKIFYSNKIKQPLKKSIYIKAKRAGWLTLYLCVHVARRRWAVAMQRGRFLFGQFYVCFLVTTTMGCYFLWGSFRGNIFFGVRSEVVFSLGSVPRVYFFACLRTSSRPNNCGFRNFVRVRWLPRIRI
jgi:hypothetical protein